MQTQDVRVLARVETKRSEPIAVLELAREKPCRFAVRSVVRLVVVSVTPFGL